METGMRILMISIICLAMATGLWAFAACISGIITAGGIAPFILSWMNAVGLIGEFSTLVGFYSHIKGVEYIICLAFLVAFPSFVRYLHKEDEKDKKIKRF